LIDEKTEGRKSRETVPTLFFAASGQLDLHFFEAAPKKKEWSKNFEKIAIPQKMYQQPFIFR
jgi:hypothetical protein